MLLIGNKRRGGGGTPTPVYPSTWTRNPDWMEMPALNPLVNEAAALYAIIEGSDNLLSFDVGNLQVATVDWGDGTIDAISSSGSHNYDYNTFSSTVYQLPDGRNYKQVIARLTYGATIQSTMRCWWSTQGRVQNVLDIHISLPDTTPFNINGGISTRTAYKPLCENITVIAIPDGAYFSVGSPSFPTLLYNLRNVDVDWSKVWGNNAQQFYNTSIIQLPDITNSHWTSAIRMFGTTLVTTSVQRVGDLDLPNITSMVRMLNGLIYQVGNITAPAATSLQHFCNGNISINSLGLIDVPQNTDLRDAFLNANNLPSVRFTDCSQVTLVTNNTFDDCWSLERLVMPGMTLGLRLNETNLGIVGFNEFATSLGTASGAQNITVTNTPFGALLTAADATAVAIAAVMTGKGYTIVN